MLIRVDFRARRRLDGRCACGREWEPLESTDGSGRIYFCPKCLEQKPNEGSDRGVRRVENDASGSPRTA